MKGEKSASYEQRLKAACFGAIVNSITGTLSMFYAVVTPFDVLKNRLQSQPTEILARSLRKPASSQLRRVSQSCRYSIARSTLPYERLRIHGLWNGIIAISKTEGLRNLWRGMVPTLLIAVPNTVVYFATLEEFRDRLNDRFGPHLYHSFIAGVVARGTAAAS